MSESGSVPAHYDQRWMDQGSCAGLARNDPRAFDTIFFPGKGKPANKRQYSRYCTGCLVQLQCLKYAVVNDLDGIWGGTTKAERESLNGFVTIAFIKEAREFGYIEHYAAPEMPVKHPSRIRDRDEEFLELEDLEQSDFLLNYQYREYTTRVEHMVEVFDDQN